MAPRRIRRAPRAPKQERASATLEAMVAAGEMLLDGRDPALLSMEDLLARAGASPSSFYQRFGSKDEFIDYLHGRFCEQITKASETLQANAADGRPLEEAMRVGAEAYFAFRRKHFGALVSFEIVEGRDPRLLERRRRVDLREIERMKAQVAQLRTRDGHAPRADRIDAAVDLAVSAIRGAVDAHRRANALGPEPDQVITEALIATVVRYLVGQ